ncbi:hypothetical protein SAMN05660745_00005 [Corynebacterium glucuronolyticum]|nr:hypothetical protein CGLUCO_05310 [Corynebacterium glucuronolyticum DSM 44120]SMB77356.1 hypothetical protein SAMN05660745_00005 [Corynebacterium glucuronolyticum]
MAVPVTAIIAVPIGIPRHYMGDTRWNILMTPGTDVKLRSTGRAERTDLILDTVHVHG